MPAGADGFSEALAGERGTLSGREPEISADTLLRHEVPGIDAALAGHGAQAATERQRLRLAGLHEPPELDPGVADAPLVAAAHEEIPFHALVAVAIGLHPSGSQIGVEKEGQRERQHLRFAGAVVAAQQQMAVEKLELLYVVVVELDQPEAQRLPALARRLRQLDCRGLASHASARSSCRASRTAYRNRAGRAQILPRTRCTSLNASRQSTACVASSASAPGARASFRQNRP